MLSYFYLSALILAPILVTLFFRKFLHEHPEATVEQLETAYTRSILFTIGGLILNAFAPQNRVSTSVTIANFSLSLMSLVWVQLDYARALELRRARMESAPPETTPPAAHLAQTFRAIVFLGCLYVLVHFLSVFGFLVFLYATPLFVRVMFETLPMAESPLRDRIYGIFREAGIELGHVRIIQSRRKRFTNAMVCGTKWGVGPCKRTLLVTEALFERLDEEELIAVLRHEASHFRLNHIRKRTLCVIGNYFLSLFMVMVPMAMVLTGMNRFGIDPKGITSFLSLFAGLGSLYWINRVTFAMIHHQEHEADVESVRLGSSPEAMISALQKITDDHGGSNTRKKSFLKRWMLNHAHPSLEERIAAIRAGAVPVREPLLVFHPARLAAAYAVMLIATYVLVASKPPAGSTPNREIASEPQMKGQTQ
jgi:Zn-dependent protease with chaperone function